MGKSGKKGENQISTAIWGGKNWSGVEKKKKEAPGDLVDIRRKGKGWPIYTGGRGEGGKERGTKKGPSCTPSREKEKGGVTFFS